MTGIQAFILAAVRDLGRTHGHEVAKDVETRTGRPVGVGTLYKTLHALQREGYLTAEWEDQPEVEYGRPRRRYYELTALGARTLEAYILSQRETTRALRPRRGTARA